MKIKSFSQQGKRSNNEDFTDYNDRLWMVCDGVGGHVSGERASSFVVQHMLDQFAEDVADLDKNRIQATLEGVQTKLNAVLETEPELERMGTTFTGIFKTGVYWYAAHIGDSRIYLFRPSEKKLWHTWDHSLVGELMRHHDITREEGRFHPMSNRISKAIIANSDGKIQSASIAKIDELKAGDLFMLCSDGVVEAWGDYELTRLFSDLNLSFEEKYEKLREQCDRLSKDNNTALLLEIEKDDAFSFGHNEELEWVTFQDIEADYQAYLNKQKADEEAEAAEKAAAEEEDNDEPNFVDVTDLLVNPDAAADAAVPTPESAPVDTPAPAAAPVTETAAPASDFESAPKMEQAPVKAERQTPSAKPSTQPSSNKPSSSGRKSKGFFIVLLLLLIIGGVVWFLTHSGKAGNKPNTPNRQNIENRRGDGNKQKTTGGGTVSNKTNANNKQANTGGNVSLNASNKQNSQVDDSQYREKMKEGDFLYLKGKYKEARESYVAALRCPNANKEMANQGIKRCDAKIAAASNNASPTTTTNTDNNQSDSQNPNIAAPGFPAGISIGTPKNEKKDSLQ